MMFRLSYLDKPPCISPRHSPLTFECYRIYIQFNYSITMFFHKRSVQHFFQPSLRVFAKIHPLSNPARVHSYTLVTMPVPTVCPPSRMLKRSPGSIAMGVMSSTSSVTLSPGMTISVPFFNWRSPVTSAVRKKN